MARGKRTEFHPNRAVSRHMFAGGGYVDVMRSPELQRDLDNRDNAPAGGIPRPYMEECSSCGTLTPKGSGTCADCK